MTIMVENTEEYNRLCRKIVKESMLKLNEQQEETVVRLMMSCMEAGYNLAKFGNAEVEI